MFRILTNVSKSSRYVCIKALSVISKIIGIISIHELPKPCRCSSILSSWSSFAFDQTAFWRSSVLMRMSSYLFCHESFCTQNTLLSYEFTILQLTWWKCEVMVLDGIPDNFQPVLAVVVLPETSVQQFFDWCTHFCT